jgi:hypothetical protein
MAAFEAFQRSGSVEEVRQAVARYPFMIGEEFIGAVERVIAQPALGDRRQRPHHHLRLRQSGPNDHHHQRPRRQQ